MIYLRNKDILEEIHKSKISYSSYLTSIDKDYDLILPNIEKINIRSVAQAKRNRAAKIAKENHAIATAENTNKKKKPRLIDYQFNWKKVLKEDLVFRISSFEHIPLQHGRVKTPKSVADHYEKLPFPPYQHFRFDGNTKESELTCVGKSHWKGDLETGEFCKEHGDMTDMLARMFIKLCDRYGTRSNWRGYTYNDEMRGQAILQLVQVGLLFDESKSQNPFAYYTAIITNSFTKILNTEKKNQNIRDDILEMNNMAPSYTRQNQNSPARTVPVPTLNTPSTT
jgi:hypothetical protein